MKLPAEELLQGMLEHADTPTKVAIFREIMVVLLEWAQIVNARLDALEAVTRQE